MRANAWIWYAALVVALGQYYFVSSVGADVDGSLYTVIAGSSLIAIVVGIALHRPDGVAGRLGWVLIASAVALYLAGDYVLASLEASDDVVVFPSIADWIYLAMYPTLLVGVVLVRSSLLPGPDRVAGLLGLAGGASAFGVLGVLYMNGYLADDTFGTEVRLASSAYPVGDVVLVAVAVWLVSGLRRSRPAPPAAGLIAAALVVIAVGNAVYNVDLADFAVSRGGAAELGWLAFTSLLGAAALHPSMVGARDGIEGSGPVLRSPRVVLAVGAVSIVSIPLGQRSWGERSDVTTSLVCVAIASLAASTAWLLERRGLERCDVAAASGPEPDAGAEFDTDTGIETAVASVSVPEPAQV